MIYLKLESDGGGEWNPTILVFCFQFFTCLNSLVNNYVPVTGNNL